MEWIIASFVVAFIVGLIAKFAYDHKREEEHLAELINIEEERKKSQEDIAG